MKLSVDLMCGDCLIEMSKIRDGSVDLVLCDLPYGKTACRWDKVIPFAPLWEHYERVLKPTGSAVLMSSQLFTAKLALSNEKLFKYFLIWDKFITGNPLNKDYQPLMVHEEICVFSKAASTYSKKSTMTYNPIMVEGKPYEVKVKEVRKDKVIFRSEILRYTRINTSGLRYPTSILRFSNASRNKIHKTQKPLNLFEYLILTYSNPGDVVLDNAMGSGTTGVACIRTGRSFIGIELDPMIFELARARIADEQSRLIETK